MPVSCLAHTGENGRYAVPCARCVGGHVAEPQPAQHDIMLVMSSSHWCVDPLHPPCPCRWACG